MPIYDSVMNNLSVNLLGAHLFLEAFPQRALQSLLM